MPIMGIMRVNMEYKLIAFPPAILILMLFLSCAGIEPKSQAMENSPLSVETEDAGTEEQPRTLSIEMYAYYFRASLYKSQGNYKKAKEYLEKVYNNDPGSLYLNKKMAVLEQRLGNFKSAVKFARECIRLDPEDMNSHMLLAELSAMNGDNETEQEAYNAILKLDPEQQRIRFLLATSLIKSNRLDEAMEQLDRLISQEPRLSFAHYYKGRIYIEWENYDAAEAAYLKALELDDTFEPALFDLAGLYQYQRKLESAVILYKRLVSLYPDNSTAQERLMGLYNTLGQKENIKELIGNIQNQSKPGDPGRQTLGIYYLQNGRYADAISEFDLIVTAWPEDHKSRYYLAWAYEESGLLEKALEHLRLIKKESEYFANSQIHIAYILSDMEKDDEAIESLKKALNLKKNESSLYLALSSLYEGKNDYKNSAITLQDGLKYDEKNIEILFRLGIALDKSGDRTNGITQMKKVLELDPDNADSLNYIGYSYAEEGINLDEALDMVQRALKLSPDSGYIIDSLGWVYYRKGLYDEALDSLEKAFSIKSDDPTIAEHLGDVYLKKNEYQRSLEMYQKALSLKHQESDKILEKIKEVRKFLQ
jgi:tetratricopeptide (TPR) repeat protein